MLADAVNYTALMFVLMILVATIVCTLAQVGVLVKQPACMYVSIKTRSNCSNRNACS